MAYPKRIGFLSFGHWHPGGGMTHTAADALRQTIELAEAAEEIGIDGAFVRVHHFARCLAAAAHNASGLELPAVVVHAVDVPHDFLGAVV